LIVEMAFRTGGDDAKTQLIVHMAHELRVLHRLLNVREQQRVAVDAASDLRLRATRQWCHEQVHAILFDAVATGAGRDAAAKNIGFASVEPSSEALLAELTQLTARIDKLDDDARRCLREQRWADDTSLRHAVSSVTDRNVDDAAVVDVDDVRLVNSRDSDLKNLFSGGARKIDKSDNKNELGSARRNGAGDDEHASREHDDSANNNTTTNNANATSTTTAKNNDNNEADHNNSSKSSDAKKMSGNSYDNDDPDLDVDDKNVADDRSTLDSARDDDDVSSISTFLPGFENRLGGGAAALQEALAAREEELRTARYETEELMKAQFRSQMRTIKRETLKMVAAFSDTMKRNSRELQRQLSDLSAMRASEEQHVAFQKNVMIQVEERLQFLSANLEKEHIAAVSSLAALGREQQPPW
jgi:hypothetical protein